jgi:hypothetical protein
VVNCIYLTVEALIILHNFFLQVGDHAEEISDFVQDAVEDLDMQEAQHENNPWPDMLIANLDPRYSSWGVNKWG